MIQSQHPAVALGARGDRADKPRVLPRSHDLRRDSSAFLESVARHHALDVLGQFGPGLSLDRTVGEVDRDRKAFVHPVVLDVRSDRQSRSILDDFVPCWHRPSVSLVSWRCPTCPSARGDRILRSARGGATTGLYLERMEGAYIPRRFDRLVSTLAHILSIE